VIWIKKKGGKVILPTSQGKKHADQSFGKEENIFTDNMLDHDISYSIVRLDENVSSKEKVFVPQSLLNNPITDPEYSERVKTYMESKQKKRHR
jgi:hypothetical protein